MYDRKSDLKKLRNYVEEQGKISENGWITLTSRVTAELLGCGATYAGEIVRELANSKDIESEPDENHGRCGKKPLKFRMKTVVDENCSKPAKDFSKFEKKPVEEKKLDVVVETKRMYPYLSDDEVCKSMTALKEHNINEKNVLEMMKMLNVMGNDPLRHENRDYTVSNVAAYLSDLLLIPMTKINIYLDILVTCNLINIYNGRDARLFPAKVQEVKATVAKPNTVEVVLDNKTLQVEQPVIEKPAVLAQEPVKTEISNEDLMKVLIDNIGDFTGFIGQFQSFFAGAYAELKKPEADPEEMNTLIAKLEALEKEHEALKDSSNKGSMALDKCYKDNSRLREDLGNLNKENRELKKVVNAFKQNADESFEFMSGRFEVVIAEITNLTSDFNRIPQWKLSETDRAKFQNNIVSAITSGIKDILDQKTSYTGN